MNYKRVSENISRNLKHVSLEDHSFYSTRLGWWLANSSLRRYFRRNIWRYM